MRTVADKPTHTGAPFGGEQGHAVEGGIGTGTLQCGRGRMMKFDASLASVLTWRVVGGIEDGTLSWRFVTTDGGTVAVRPLQLPSNARPVCVPESIRSAMRSASRLIDLAHGRCGVNGEPKGPDYRSIDAAIKKNSDHAARNSWQAKVSELQKRVRTMDPAPWKDAFNCKLAEEAVRSGPELYAEADDLEKKELSAKYIASIPAEQYEDRLRRHVLEDLLAHEHAALRQQVQTETDAECRAYEEACHAARRNHEEERKHFFRTVALYELNDFIGRTAGKKPVPVHEPGKGGGYTATERAAIVKRLTDQKNPGAKKLENIRSFILQSLFRPAVKEVIEAPQDKPTSEEPKTYPPPAGPFRDADLRRLVRFIGEQIGQDMTLPVLLGYNSAMREMFKGWVAETVKTRKIKPKAAEQLLAKSVTFIAECEGRRFQYCYPIEDIIAEHDVKDQEDRALHQILIRHEDTSSQGHGTAHAAKYTKNEPTGEKAEEKPIKRVPEHPLAYSAVTFADAFTTIHYPFDDGQPLKLRATLKVKVLQRLFENWGEKENDWLDWADVANSIGMQGAQPDPYRFLEDRKNKRPEIKRVLHEIIQRKKDSSKTRTDYSVRLNPAYSYSATS
jgi:hypothetical protein